MKKTHIGAVALGILGALIGFSFALATPQNSAPPVGARAVGQNLRFSNPLLLAGQDVDFPAGGAAVADPNGYDLGDAYFGVPIRRYLTATDGVQPYSFTSAAALPTTLTLGIDGRVTGAIDAAAGTPAKFNATLTDAAAKTRTGSFRIFTTAVVPGVFRFAHDRLSDARVGSDYITNIETLGGDNTVKFSIVTGTATFNAAPITDLETLGLRVFDDGTIAGRPLKSGMLTFTLHAQTTAGAIANNRANATPDQPLTITIAAMDNVQSVFGTYSSVIRGDLNKPGRDSFVYNVYFDPNAMRDRDYANAVFTLRLAGKTFTTTLNQAGQSFNGPLQVSLLAPEGLLSVSLRNQSLGALFTPADLTDAGKKISTIEIEVGNKFAGTEPIEYSVRNRNGRFTMTYRLAHERQVGGLFQIYALQGDDRSNGTAFRTKFLLSQVPDSSSQTFGAATNATINIGPAFTEDVVLKNGVGSFRSPGLSYVLLRGDKKYGIITTYALTEADTGIKPSRNAGGIPQNFLLGAKITTPTQTFNGAASVAIFPVRGF